METEWLILITVVAVIIIIVVLVWRDQRDKNKYVKELIDEDETAIPKDPDTEVDTEDDVRK
jgi:FtsZ-interacting cell division protein ZipA